MLDGQGGAIPDPGRVLHNRMKNNVLRVFRQVRSGWLRIAALLVFAGAIPAYALEQGEWDWGFLASRLKDPDGTMRTRAVGPFLEWSSHPSGARLTAVRPLYASETDPASGWLHRDFLWPVGRYGRLDNDSSWRVLVAYSHHYDLSDPKGRYRFWIVPLYFQGRDTHGRNYLALFPVGGRIHEILNLDETAFVLFPLWGRCSVGDVQTRHVLWPVLSRTWGGGEDRFRVFPFYGWNRQGNNFDKRFVLWPIFTDVRYTYPNSSGYGYILFPLWGRFQLTDQQTRYFLPPLIRITRSQRQNMVTVWPFYQRRTGQEDRLNIWPFYGYSRVPGRERSYYVWPVIRRESIDRGDAVLSRTFVIPFYKSRTLAPRKGAEVPKEHHVMFWPLLTYDRDGADRRVRSLALWPLRRTSHVNRSWSDLWTLVEFRSRGEERRTDVLWGLYRRQVRGDEWRRTSIFPLVEWEAENGPDHRERSWSLLKGLIAREDSKRGVRYRMLYFIRWGGSREEVETP